jgi:hypothetical protein
VRRGGILFGLALLAIVVAGCSDGAVVSYTTGHRPVDAAVADVNGDGRPDIVTLNAGSNDLTVRLQGPHGFFDDSYTLTLPKGAQPSAIVAGTFHANGRPTIVVANRGGDSISIFDSFKAGSGPTKTISLGPGSAPAALAIGNVDGDGDQDLLVTSRQPTFPGCMTKGCILVFKDKGDGLAYSYAAYPVGTDDNVDYNPVALAVGDLWGGGRPEIAVVDKGTDQAVVIDTKNDGFEKASSYTTVSFDSPTDVQIDESAKVGVLAVEGAKSGAAFFGASAPGKFALTRRFEKPGFYYDGVYFAYDRDAGSVQPLTLVVADQAISAPALQNLTGVVGSEFDGIAKSPDFVGIKGGGDSIVVFTESHPWSSPDELELRATQVGSTSKGTLKGRLGTNVRVGIAIAVTGPDASSFKATGCDTLTGPVSTCAITVTFAPTSPGVKHATLLVSTIQSGGATDNSFGMIGGRPAIALTGKATPAPTPTPSGPGSLVTGVADDYGKYAGDGGSWFFSTLRSLGMGENRMTVAWQPGEAALPGSEAAFLDRSIAEAQRQGTRVVLSIYPAVASQHDPAQFCDFARGVAQRYPSVKEIIVGNEPNKADFWSPVDPAAYTQLLARCYDELHPLGVTVAGGALSARKVGRGASPVEFLAGMGAAYRALGRTAPVMDALSFHPYPNPDRIEKGAGAGYEWPNAGPPDLDRVKQAVEDAFGGTGQPTFSSSLRMVIDEIGWQARILPPYASLYTGAENAPAVDESQQAQFDADAIALFACDPAVSELLLLHLVDEKELNASATSGGWQSGLFRADLSQRPAFASVQHAIAAGCTGARHAWTPATSVVGGSIALGAVQQQVRVAGKTQHGVKFTVGASAAEGVAWTLTVKNAAGTVVATRKGTRSAPFDTKTFTTPVLVGSGSYTATMTMTATLNGKRTLTATKTASSAS